MLIAGVIRRATGGQPITPSVIATDSTRCSSINFQNLAGDAWVGTDVTTIHFPVAQASTSALFRWPGCGTVTSSLRSGSDRSAFFRMPVSCQCRRSGTVVTRTTAAGWPHTGRVEAEARQVAAEGPRCALDEEAWPQLLRLQEPCERGRQAQADPALCRERCGRARQQELDGLLDKGNTCNDVFGDSAYRSTEIEAQLRASGYKSRIHRRGRRNYPLSSAQERANHAKSRIALISSMCSGRSRARRAVGSCARLAWCGRAPRSACRTWPTTFAAW